MEFATAELFRCGVYKSRGRAYNHPNTQGELTMIDVNVSGDVLTITIDVSAAAVSSAPKYLSSERLLIASSHDVIPVMTAHGAMSLSLNLTMKP